MIGRLLSLIIFWAGLFFYYFNWYNPEGDSNLEILTDPVSWMVIIGLWILCRIVRFIF